MNPASLTSTFASPAPVSTAPGPTSLLASQPASTQPASKTKAVDCLKCVLFDIGKLTLGLPMQRVSKVVHMPEVYSSGLYAVGVSRIGDVQLTIVDLHQRLFQTPMSLPTERRSYLVLVAAGRGEWLGIPVLETPVLLDIPLAQIRQLPEAYRRSDTLSIASHLAKATLEDGSDRTMFLLDTECLLETMG